MKRFLVFLTAILILGTAAAGFLAAPPEPSVPVMAEEVRQAPVAAEPEPLAAEPEYTAPVRSFSVELPRAEAEVLSDLGSHLHPNKREKLYYFRVNNETNTVTVYIKDDNGEYTVPIKAMICSTGSATPVGGVYHVGWRLRWQDLFGNVYGQYVVQITGNILFHSVPYCEKYNPSSLEYWEFDLLGTSASAGCVRLQVEDAKWIYDRFDFIDAVEFYYDADPGPLGKPTAPLISEDEQRRGWDPSDPDEHNPWVDPDAVYGNDYFSRMPVYEEVSDPPFYEEEPAPVPEEEEESPGHIIIP